MGATANAERSPPADDSEDLAPGQKMVCLASWLERTTLKEAEAAQAYALLPIGILAIGTVFAAIFIGIEQTWFAIASYIIFAGAALSLLLHNHRRWAIWHAAAIRLQNEQKLLADRSQARAWAKAGRYPPEQLAQWYARKEPLRPFAGPALAFYLATIALAILLSAFTADQDGALQKAKPTIAFDARITPKTWRPIF